MGIGWTEAEGQTRQSDMPLAGPLTCQQVDVLPGADGLLPSEPADPWGWGARGFTEQRQGTVQGGSDVAQWVQVSDELWGH